MIPEGDHNGVYMIDAVRVSMGPMLSPGCIAEFVYRPALNSVPSVFMSVRFLWFRGLPFRGVGFLIISCPGVLCSRCPAAVLRATMSGLTKIP